jgi:hypothetical protein
MINKKSANQTPLDLAIKAVGGSQKVLAEKVGVTPQAINMLKKRGESFLFPRKRCGSTSRQQAYREQSFTPKSLPPN